MRLREQEVCAHTPADLTCPVACLVAHANVTFSVLASECRFATLCGLLSV
jgi:hypothetical protein